MIWLANDKVRFFHYTPNLPGEAKGTFSNSNPEDARKAGGKLEMKDEDLKKMWFKKNINYQQSLELKLDSSLNGMRTFSIGLQTKLIKDPKLYNGWNFTDNDPWDGLQYMKGGEQSFWWSLDN